MKLLWLISVLLCATATTSNAEIEAQAERIIDNLRLDENLSGLLGQTVPRTQTYQMVSTKCPFSRRRLFREGVTKAQEQHAKEWNEGITRALRATYGDTWITETSELPPNEMISAFRNPESLNSYGAYLEKGLSETLTVAVTTTIEHMWSECLESTSKN